MIAILFGAAILATLLWAQCCSHDGDSPEWHGNDACGGEQTGHDVIDRALVHDKAGTLVVVAEPFLRTGLLARWRFFNTNNALCPTGNEIGRKVTPLLVRPVDFDTFEVVAVGRTRTNDGSGVQESAFEAVAGSPQIRPGDCLGWRDGGPEGGDKGCVELDLGSENTAFVTEEELGPVSPGTVFTAAACQRSYSIQALATQPQQGEPLLTAGGVAVFDAQVVTSRSKRTAGASLALARTKDGPREALVTVRIRTRDGNIMEERRETDLTGDATPVAAGVSDIPEGESLLEREVTPGDGCEPVSIGTVRPFMPKLLRIMPGRSFYTDETTGHVIVEPRIPFDCDQLTVTLSHRGKEMAASTVDVSARMLVPFDLAKLPQGTSELACRVATGGQAMATKQVAITRLEPKANEVKIDYAGRGLIADGLPYFACGFYALLPDALELVDAEAVHGFNLISPYQAQFGEHSPEKLARCREYMDRCADVGMKVNYHLVWFSHQDRTEKTWADLKEEIEAIRDHPALLSWYIDDEPGLWLHTPEQLEGVYDLIKQLDPYHPVTITFCKPHLACQFTHAMDIVMIDPYPLHRAPVTVVSEWADMVGRGVDHEMPVWVVPQAAGGLPRIGTRQEMRVMTYLALIHGVRGIQYFIRTPESLTTPWMWAACREVAMESTLLGSSLISGEPEPGVKSSVSTVHAAAWRDRGLVTVLVANALNKPQTARFRLADIDYSGPAALPFEFRDVDVVEGEFEDMMDAYGTRVYTIPVGPFPQDDLDYAPGARTATSYETGTPDGIPLDSVFERGEDATATCFVDPRVARHGRCSVRLTASGDNEGCHLTAKSAWADNGQTWKLSIWAKAERPGAKMTLSAVDVCTEEFVLDTEWREYVAVGVSEKDRTVPKLSFHGPGTAWFDLFQFAPVEA